MRDERTDAQMVGAYLNGDASAFAGIYDRYADALHDTAAGMLRDFHDAADTTQDVFLIAAERLGQLRDQTGCGRGCSRSCATRCTAAPSVAPVSGRSTSPSRGRLT